MSPRLLAATLGLPLGVAAVADGAAGFWTGKHPLGSLITVAVGYVGLMLTVSLIIDEAVRLATVRAWHSPGLVHGDRAELERLLTEADADRPDPPPGQEALWPRQDGS